jgi:hypothetical protein
MSLRITPLAAFRGVLCSAVLIGLAPTGPVHASLDPEPVHARRCQTAAPDDGRVWIAITYLPDLPPCFEHEHLAR